MTTPVIHYFPPGRTDQNICKRRRGRNWAASMDPGNVTCKRCRQLLRGNGGVISTRHPQSQASSTAV